MECVSSGKSDPLPKGGDSDEDEGVVTPFPVHPPRRYTTASRSSPWVSPLTFRASRLFLSALSLPLFSVQDCLTPVEEVALLGKEGCGLIPLSLSVLISLYALRGQCQGVKPTFLRIFQIIFKMLNIDCEFDNNL